MNNANQLPGEQVETPALEGFEQRLSEHLIAMVLFFLLWGRDRVGDGSLDGVRSMALCSEENVLIWGVGGWGLVLQCC